MTKDSGRRLSLSSDSEEATERLGHRLAAVLPPACVVGLCGGLGAGKTCFTRGLATGLGADPTTVTSPSFVYLVEYPDLKHPLIHADLYRLGGLSGEATATALESIGLFAAIGSQAITAVEWWENYLGPSPQSLVTVEFEIENTEDRSISLEFKGRALESAAASLKDYGR